MFAGLAAWAATKLGKWALIGGAILIVISLVVGGIYAWKYKIQAEQAAKDQNIILQQVIKEQADWIQKTKELQAAQDAATKALQDQIKSVQDDNKQIRDYLDSPEAKKNDKPSSDIIKEVLKQLGKQKR